jgi:hypothetical protein
VDWFTAAGAVAFEIPGIPKGEDKLYEYVLPKKNFVKAFVPHLVDIMREGFVSACGITAEELDKDPGKLAMAIEFRFLQGVIRGAMPSQSSFYVAPIPAPKDVDELRGEAKALTVESLTDLQKALLQAQNAGIPAFVIGNEESDAYLQYQFAQMFDCKTLYESFLKEDITSEEMLTRLREATTLALGMPPGWSKEDPNKAAEKLTYAWPRPLWLRIGGGPSLVDLSEVLNTDTERYTPSIFSKPDMDELFKVNLIDRLTAQNMKKNPERRKGFALWMSTTLAVDKVFKSKLTSGLPYFKKFRFIIFQPTPDRPESQLSLADIKFDF